MNYYCIQYFWLHTSHKRDGRSFRAHWVCFLKTVRAVSNTRPGISSKAGTGSVGVLTACAGFVQVNTHTHVRARKHTHSWPSHVHGRVPVIVWGRTHSLTCVFTAAVRVIETPRADWPSVWPDQIRQGSSLHPHQSTHLSYVIKSGLILKDTYSERSNLREIEMIV